MERGWRRLVRPRRRGHGHQRIGIGLRWKDLLQAIRIYAHGPEALLQPGGSCLGVELGGMLVSGGGLVPASLGGEPLRIAELQWVFVGPMLEDRGTKQVIGDRLFDEAGAHRRIGRLLQSLDDRLSGIAGAAALGIRSSQSRVKIDQLAVLEIQADLRGRQRACVVGERDTEAAYVVVRSAIAVDESDRQPCRSAIMNFLGQSEDGRVIQVHFSCDSPTRTDIAIHGAADVCIPGVAGHIAVIGPSVAQRDRSHVVGALGRCGMQRELGELEVAVATPS